MIEGGIDVSASFDTPTFREAIVDGGARVAELGRVLKRVCAAGAEWQAHETQASQSLMAFSAALGELRDDAAPAAGDLNRVLRLVADSVAELTSLRQVLVSQLSHCLLKPASDFKAGPVADAKAACKTLAKLVDAYDSALSRKSSTRRDKLTQKLDTGVAAARHEYNVAALRASLAVNRVLVLKQCDLAERVAAFLYGLGTFHHAAHHELTELAPKLRQITDGSEKMRDKFLVERVPLEARLAQLEIELQQAAELSSSSASSTAPTSASASPQPARRALSIEEKRTEISGYLFKRSHNLRKDWKRRFFVVHDGTLSYTTTADNKSAPTTFPLVLSTVREARDCDRANAFEVVSATHSILLMAEDKKEMDAWVGVLRNAIAASLNQQKAEPARRGRQLATTASSRRADDTAMNAARRPPAVVMGLLWKVDAKNRQCADCGTDEATWCSISLGVLLCIDCAGVHRRIGVHVSKVRSLELDTLLACDLQLLARLGNTVSAGVFEKDVPADAVRATPTCDADVLDAWIRAKYELRRFVGAAADLRDQDARGRELCDAAARDDVRRVQQLLAIDPAILDWHTSACGPAVVCAAACSTTIRSFEQLSPTPTPAELAERPHAWAGAASLSFLINRGAKIDVRAAYGVTCTHVLARRDSAALLNTVIVAGGRGDTKDDNGHTPFDEAMRSQAADSVTLLRLAALAFNSGVSSDDNEFISSFRAFVTDARFQTPPAAHDALVTRFDVDNAHWSSDEQSNEGSSDDDDGDDNDDDE